ncbi:39S ribosomal protein L51, mitochondrial [Lecanora helva]
MPVRGIRTTSTARNGVGAFILQCKRLEFHYCDLWGSSKGMNQFLRSPLIVNFARAHPGIQIHISPRPSNHPIIRGRYNNGREKVICVRNLEKEQILKKVEMLRDANGEKVRRVKGGRVVGSLNESVRGIWDPFHGGNKEIAGDRLIQA